MIAVVQCLDALVDALQHLAHVNIAYVRSHHELSHSGALCGSSGDRLRGCRAAAVRNQTDGAARYPARPERSAVFIEPMMSTLTGIENFSPE